VKRSVSGRSLLFLAIILVAVVTQLIQGGNPLFVLVGLALVAPIVWPLVRPRPASPVTIDEPGIQFGDVGGSGSRLVPWESITGVVLFEVPRTDTSGSGWQPAIGVQLAGHPDGVSVQRPLGGWTVDRIALERAVARFGGGVAVIDGDRPDSQPTEEQMDVAVRQAVTEAARDAQARDAGEKPRIEWHHTARYVPADPAAYLARFDLRSNFAIIAGLVVAQVFFWAVVVPQAGGVGVFIAIVFALPLVFVWRTLRGGGAVALAVDRPGVFFGESTSPGEDQTNRLVTWPEITAVVVYEELIRGSKSSDWKRTVGIRLRGEPTLIRHSRIISGWRLDRPALEAAVARFAPGVPVIDGPPQRDRPGSASDAMRRVLEIGPEVWAEEERRRNGLQ
jgi:hypothetical protein